MRFYHAVRRKQHVGAIADEKMLGNRNAGRFQRSISAEQRRRIDHQSVADHGLLAGAQNAAWNQLQDEFLFADENRMTGICPP